MNSNGYKEYKKQAVTTMTRGEMLNLLFDEFVKRLNCASTALQEDNMDEFNFSIQRCADIVNYLRATLNRSYQISREIRRMYDFFSYEISRIQAGRRKEVIDELKPLVMDLRDAFREAGKLSGI